jgi:hypothetical protein
MKLFYEWDACQLIKRGEELCGDSIEVSRGSDTVTMVLSDGLGSGVKANILATLTTQIAMRLLEDDLPLEDVVQTLTETLPVDKERKMAYSTFAIAQFHSDGTARVVEFDTPATILIRNSKLQKLDYTSGQIEKKRIQQTHLELKDGDWIVFVSDGVLNAGIGGVYPLGWGWDQAAAFMEQRSNPAYSAGEFAERIAESVQELYAGNIGDDVSIVVIKVRKKLIVTVFTGPPEDSGQDEEIVGMFLSKTGRRAVCGGTTAKIVSRCMKEPLEVDLTTMTGDVPPTGTIRGIDLVTEGILTLTKANNMLQRGETKDSIKFQSNGAASLVRLMLDADSIHFLVGQAVNPAHQNPELPHQLGIRLSMVRETAEELRQRGKEVVVQTV